ncbi:MAG: hypothetical protein LBP53_07920 [Candidatus Peribacteria bacterium]|jgi:hypothetical protein|nr:hypothetical protein [Candidatus Peribacteria bacterium]
MKNVLIWLFALLLIIPWVIIGWLIYTGQIVIQFTSHQQPATIEKLVNVYNEVIIEDKLDINMKIVDKNALPI